MDIKGGNFLLISVMFVATLHVGIKPPSYLQVLHEFSSSGIEAG